MWFEYELADELFGCGPDELFAYELVDAEVRNVLVGGVVQDE